MDAIKLAKRFVPPALYPSSVLRREVVRRTGRTVHAGPFAGLRYVSEGVCGCYMPKLLGTYERELHDFVGRILGGGFDAIVNVGAAEGYYSVGLLQRMPEVRGVAFEASPGARALIDELARLNDVRDRLEILGRCEPSDLEREVGRWRRPVVLCDVEGYEDALLDPDRVPALSRATMLIEVHDHLVPGISSALLERFERSHTSEVIRQERRAPSEYPFASPWTRAFPWLLTRYVLNEFRSRQVTWLWLAPRGEAGSGPPRA